MVTPAESVKMWASWRETFRALTHIDDYFERGEFR
jgi:hypothetical protein